MLSPQQLLKKLKTLYDAPHYALAVSGGADSMGLLAYAAKMARRKNAPRFSVLTVDHGLRPQAVQETRIVKQTATQLGLPCTILRWQGAIPQSGVQQKARDIRYELMGDWCKAHGGVPLIVAHHMQDQAETVLMRLAHGSAVDGLAGMAMVHTRKSLTVLRPFLDVDKQDLAHFARKLGVRWIDDPSNENTAFERVRWRQNMAYLHELGLSAQGLVNMSDAMRETRIALDYYRNQFIQTHIRHDDMGFLIIERAAFSRLPPLMQSRILAFYLAHFGADRPYNVSHKRLSALRGLINAQKTGGLTIAGCLVRLRKAHILIGAEAARLAAMQPLTLMPGNTVLWDRRFHITAKKPLICKALGKAGLAHLRARGMAIRTDVPVHYLYALPALWYKNGNVRDCPPLSGKRDLCDIFMKTI